MRVFMKNVILKYSLESKIQPDPCIEDIFISSKVSIGEKEKIPTLSIAVQRKPGVTSWLSYEVLLSSIEEIVCWDSYEVDGISLEDKLLGIENFIYLGIKKTDYKYTDCVIILELKDKESYLSIKKDLFNISKKCWTMTSSPSDEKVIDYIKPLQIAAMKRNFELLSDKFNDESETDNDRPLSTCLSSSKSKQVNNINIEDDKNIVDVHADKPPINTKIISSNDHKDIADDKYPSVATEPDNNITIPGSKKCFLIKEVKFTYDQMLSLNEKLISTSAFKFTSTRFDSARDLISDFIPDDKVMINMTDCRQILDHNPKDYKGNTPNDDLFLTYSLLNVNSYWMFQQHPSQRCMISLPAETYESFIDKPGACINNLRQHLSNFEHIFEFTCIDIVIWHNDHYSRVFVLNAKNAIKKLIGRPNEHDPAIYFCNSSNFSGRHSIKQITNFIVQFLNCTKKYFEKWKFESIAEVGPRNIHFKKTCFQKCKLITPIQQDTWSCGYHSLLARDNFLDFLLSDVIQHHKPSLKSKTKPIPLPQMQRGNILGCRSDLLRIINFLEQYKTDSANAPNRSPDVVIGNTQSQTQTDTVTEVPH